MRELIDPRQTPDICLHTCPAPLQHQPPVLGHHVDQVQEQGEGEGEGQGEGECPRCPAPGQGEAEGWSQGTLLGRLRAPVTRGAALQQDEKR